jgi:hypothetical protein
MLDGNRFGRLARAHFAEQRRGYAWFLAAGLLIQVLVSILYAVGEDGLIGFKADTQQGYYLSGLYLLGTIFAGRYFLGMGQRAPALLALMRPASVLEKWLLAALVVLLAYPIAFTIGYFLVDIPVDLVAAAQAQARAGQQLALWQHHAVGSRPAAFDAHDYRLFLPWEAFGTWRQAVAMLLWLSSLYGLSMFGSLYFRAVPFIKSLLAALLFVLLVALCSEWLGGDASLVLNYWEHPRYLRPAQEIGYAMLWIGFPGALWLACYRALREREIAA